MRQLHISFNSAKTWHVIVCCFLCFAPNLPELNQKLFCSDVQNKFMLSSGKFGAKNRNQQTITCQVLAELNKIWSCLIFIQLYIILQILVQSSKLLYVGKFLICLEEGRKFDISFVSMQCNKTSRKPSKKEKTFKCLDLSIAKSYYPLHAD